MANTYSTTHGERLTRNQIERRIRAAKTEFIEDHQTSRCERGIKGTRFTISHVVSVKYALEHGMAELAWDKENNFELLSEAAHADIERWKNHKRLAYYEARKQGMSYTDFEKHYDLIY